ncbi:hypothetical protein DWX10_14655 [Clostridium sp. AF18-27]|nr:hypothetical protein DWX10_14655 [Clostridium sp. AF18-27]
MFLHPLNQLIPLRNLRHIILRLQKQHRSHGPRRLRWGGPFCGQNCRWRRLRIVRGTQVVRDLWILRDLRYLRVAWYLRVVRLLRIVRLPCVVRLLRLVRYLRIPRCLRPLSLLPVIPSIRCISRRRDRSIALRRTEKKHRQEDQYKPHHSRPSASASHRKSSPSYPVHQSLFNGNRPNIRFSRHPNGYLCI